MVAISSKTAVAVLASGLLAHTHASSMVQVMNQSTWNSLPGVLPVSRSNATTIFTPPGHTEESLKSRPFHVYDDEFYDVIGQDPALTLIAHQSEGYEIFHEAVVWHPATDEMFFVQNSGSLATTPGYNTSSGVYKVSLAEIETAVQSGVKNVSGSVTVHEVQPEPKFFNPNGGTNYKDQILYVTKGQGPDVAPSLYLMSAEEPYNSTMILSNYFGRQFTSLNDIVVHPRNGDIYFTDTLSAWLQGFRPQPGLQPQAYRWNTRTGALTVVADGFTVPNGLTFSPDGSKVYIVDSGAHYGPDWNFQNPATIYQYDVLPNGNFAHRQVFAYASPGTPDGIHCDGRGNVWSGAGDGVHVWNPDGVLIGKIYVGETVANFGFAGRGRIVITAETNLYYATVDAGVGSA